VKQIDDEESIVRREKLYLLVCLIQNTDFNELIIFNLFVRVLIVNGPQLLDSFNEVVAAVP
jgi:hypothetical protein